MNIIRFGPDKMSNLNVDLHKLGIFAIFCICIMTSERYYSVYFLWEKVLKTLCDMDTLLGNVLLHLVFPE